MNSIEDQRDAWMDSAAMFARNADYWRGRAERAERFSVGRLLRLVTRFLRRDRFA